MSKAITIALDAMGGDDAPEIVVQGADIIKKSHPNLTLVFVGDKKQLTPLLEKTQSVKDAQIIHTTAQIAADDKPSSAVRRGRQSSMWLAIQEVAEQRADAVVSAGNTGALMAMAKLQLRMMEGISRPAISTFLPTLSGPCCMLDLGANIEVDETNLVQFAMMGVAFYRDVVGKANPSVGLLNVGEEEQKGFDYLRLAAQELSRPEMGINYHGFIEGSDIGAGTTDIVVTDGFTGNIALKTTEGTAKLLQHMMRESFTASWLNRLRYLIAKPAIDLLRQKLDPRTYNGAVLLGLNGIAVKSHGGTDGFGYAHAIEVAANLVEHGFIDEVSEAISEANRLGLLADDKSGSGDETPLDTKAS